MLNDRMSRVILGVENNACYEQIKLAYKVLLRKYHPDTAAVPNRYLLERVILAYNFLKENKEAEKGSSVYKAGAKKKSRPDKAGKSRTPGYYYNREGFGAKKTRTALKDYDSVFVNDVKPWDKLAAVSRLACTGKKSSYFYLRQALHDSDKRVVHASIKAIGRLKIIQAADEFSAIYRNSGPDTRSEILRAVNEIGVFKPFNDIIISGLYDRDVNIRMQTISIYKNMLLKRNEK